MIDAITHYYLADNANIHRGVHELSQRSTHAYEGTRTKLKKFLNAPDAHEMIFVRGTTEAINLVACSYGRKHVKEGDEIIVSAPRTPLQHRALADALPRHGREAARDPDERPGRTAA